MPNPSILERENDDLHPRERIVQEYRQATPVATCPDLLHGNQLWEERCELAARVKALEEEISKLRAVIHECCACRFERITGRGEQYEECHLHACERHVCKNGDPTEVTLLQRVAELESALADARQFAATWKAEASEQRQLAERLKKGNANGAALRQVFYDTTQEAFAIGQQLHNRATKAECLFMAVWEKLYNAVRDHETGLCFVQGVQVATEQLEAERDRLAADFAELRKRVASSLPVEPASDLRQLAARESS